ncbi:MAG: hypothetical protein R3D30_11655 [Hyphomicrobiales bacterium]
MSMDGDQSFDWIGKHRFHDREGELRHKDFAERCSCTATSTAVAARPTSIFTEGATRLSRMISTLGRHPPVLHFCERALKVVHQRLLAKTNIDQKLDAYIKHKFPLLLQNKDLSHRKALRTL